MRNNLHLLLLAGLIAFAGCSSNAGKASRPLGWRDRDGSPDAGVRPAAVVVGNSVSYTRQGGMTASQASVQRNAGSPRLVRPVVGKSGQSSSVSAVAKGVSPVSMPSRVEERKTASLQGGTAPARTSATLSGAGHDNAGGEASGDDSKYKMMRDLGFITEDQYKKLIQEKK